MRSEHMDHCVAQRRKHFAKSHIGNRLAHSFIADRVKLFRKPSTGISQLV
jgi:hypothetical protein